MTKQAPSAPLSNASSPTGIEVTVRWDDAVLLVRHLSAPGVFWLAEQSGTYPGREFVVPEGTLALERMPLVIAHSNEDVRLVVPPSGRARIRLAEDEYVEVDTRTDPHRGSRAQLVKLERGFEGWLHLGQLSFEVRVGDRARPIQRASWRPRLLRLGALAAVSLGLHLGLGACSYYQSPSPRDGGGLTEEQRYLVQHYLDGAEERSLEESEAEEIAETEGGATGTRAKGSEGSMGNPNGARQDSRYGVAGPDAEPPSPPEALRKAAEFGMVGLLNTGAGGNPDAPTAPWGRDDSLGSSPRDARGRGVGPASGRGGQGLTSGARWPTLEQPGTSRRPIDPNGRFATTYRPGRGHLTAFDAAIARGTLPPTTRELVGEVGGRYAPSLTVPPGRALGYSVSLERSSLPPDGGPIHLRIALRSGESHSQSRPRLSVHVALDTSGSMSGEPLERAKEAANHLVENLASNDEFSLTTFSGEARVVVASGPVGPRRAAIREVITETEASGSTNIGEALESAYAQASFHARTSDAVPIVMLLSDGQPTAGTRNRGDLSFLALEAFQKGIQTSTFGLGSEFDAQLMSGVASDGAGGYYYLQHADQISVAFRTELRQRLDPAATAVEVRIRLQEDVSLLNVYGSRRLDSRESAVERAKEIASDTQAEQRGGIRRDRQQDATGGMRFFIPAFSRSDAYSLLVELDVPPGVDPRSIGTFELRYKDWVNGTNVGEESPIRVGFAADDASSAATIDPSVARTIQGHAAGEALLAAANSVGGGRKDVAITRLRERQQILLRAAKSLDEPWLEQDANRFSRLLALLEDEQPVTGPLALAVVLETAARSHLQ